MNTENQDKYMLTATQDLINLCPSNVKEQLSDSYHDFLDLYNIRLAYNVALFNEWAKDYYEFLNGYKGVDPRTLHPEIRNQIINLKPKYNVHKSWKHYDGKLCFGGGWFIVVAVLPTGQISNHYKAEHWDKFLIPEVDKALYEFDGHTTQDCIDRLMNL